MGSLFGCILLTAFLVPLLTPGTGELNKDKDQTVEFPNSVNYYDRSVPINFYTYFLAHYEEDDEANSKIIKKRNEPNEDDEDFPPMRDLLAGGPLENRRFVAVDVLPRSGKRIERSFRFPNSLSRGKRHDDEDIFDEKPKPSTKLNESVAKALKKVPKGFVASTVLVRYSHQLTAVEKAGDSSAKLGSPCQQTTILKPDYCERAAYPNKNKMVCNMVEDKAKNLVPHTCICKFFKTTEVGNDWKQMRTGKVTLNGEEVTTCLVPRMGVCNHRIFTGYLDNAGRPIYEVDLCQGHFQCDNTAFIPSLKNGTITVKKHCSENQFLDQFEEENRPDVLLCAKPTPSGFTNYDEFKFYCLPERLRDENYKASNSITENSGEQI